jgi:hypothetical protein
MSTLPYDFFVQLINDGLGTDVAATISRIFDDDALDAARAHLGTSTIKDTVNEALRSAAHQRSAQLASALSVLADADLDDRSAAWR